MAQTTPPTAPRATPALPELAPGVTLLETDRDTPRAIHALVVDHVLRTGGKGYWVDTGRQARADPLVEIAPSDRILGRLRVTRAFTPFQHLDCLRELPRLCSEQTSLVVVPALDQFYRDENLLADEGREMLASGVAALAGVARRREVPVLVTRQTADAFSQPLAQAATRTLRCTATPFGPRFESADSETLVYSVDGGETVQTTLAFWERVITARQPIYDTATPAQPEVSARGAH